jgi:hypothetical protein
LEEVLVHDPSVTRPRPDLGTLFLLDGSNKPHIINILQIEAQVVQLTADVHCRIALRLVTLLHEVCERYWGDKDVSEYP